MEEGMEKGLQKGLQEGLQEGLQKGKESTARNMKAEGITPLIIQKCTGLSLEEIERL
jgi:predicted transposase/invertase (TIGR01784 family)